MHTVRRQEDGTWHVGYLQRTEFGSKFISVATDMKWESAFRLVNYLNGGTGEVHHLMLDYKVEGDL